METEGLDFAELQQAAEAFEKLASDTQAFNEAHAAFMENSAARFEAALNKAGIAEHCHLVCYLFCKKHCGALCRKFCPKPHTEEVNAAEVLAFVKAITPLLRDEAVIRGFNDIIDKEDVQAWNELLKRLKLERFCYQLCVLFCSWRCKRRCILLCPPKPLITRVGSIPVSQINPLGYGSGPSIPPFYVGPPNPAAGYGDHPFGGAVWLMGIFNMPTAIEYLVEVSSTGPGGPYTPVLVGPQGGYDQVNPSIPPPPVPPNPPQPPFVFQFFRTRSQSGGPDPGWFQINQLTDSDGGRLTTGEKTLMMWPTSAPDGVYYLRLRVRDAMTTRVSGPQVVRLDNTGPFPLPRPTIGLQLQKPDGTLVPLKCGKVRKGDGLIRITIHAYDPNMSHIAVTARGNSGLSVPVVSTTAVPLSKTYNGNIADQGYVVPTSFLWDPWSDPNIVPCCYLVYVEVWDRAILDNTYSGGHYNAGWEALEIGL